MTTEQIRIRLHAQPFRRLIVKTTGGREYVVNHPELATFSPNGRVMHLWVAEDAGIDIDVLMIESIHPVERDNGKRRRKAA